MATLERRRFVLTLNQTLLADAALSGAVGLVSLGTAGRLASSLDLPTAFLAGLGMIAVAYGAALAMLARRTPVPSDVGRAVVLGNLLWAATGILLLVSDWIDPNSLGVGFILVHIVGALVFAEMQAMALRASR